MCRGIVVIWAIYLGVLAREDSQSHTVSRGGLGAGFLLLLGSQYCVEGSYMQRLLGMGVGVLFLFISWLTKEKIGYGDSCLFIILGGLLGLDHLVMCMISGFLLCSIYGIVMIAMKKCRREDGVPFLPFLLLGYLITVGLL